LVIGETKEILSIEKKDQKYCELENSLT